MLSVGNCVDVGLGCDGGVVGVLLRNIIIPVLFVDRTEILGCRIPKEQISPYSSGHRHHPL